jgi:hypothetical protein
MKCKRTGIELQNDIVRCLNCLGYPFCPDPHNEPGTVAEKEITAGINSVQLYIGSDAPELYKSFGKILLDMWGIFLKKQEMRGKSNISQQGLLGVVNRIVQDKGQRILNEVQLREAVKIVKEKLPQSSIPELPEYSESLEDDLLDTANYCIIALLLLRGQWR